MKKAAETVLGDALECMESDAADTVFSEVYKDIAMNGEHLFNASTLVCLAKDPSGEDPCLGQYYFSKATRPLSIVNSDNRLIASAMRLRWESHLAEYIQERRQ